MDAPIFNEDTNKITIPNNPRIKYYVDGAEVSGEVSITAATMVTAKAVPPASLRIDSITDWLFEPNDSVSIASNEESLGTESSFEGQD